MRHSSIAAGFLCLLLFASVADAAANLSKLLAPTVIEDDVCHSKECGLELVQLHAGQRRSDASLLKDRNALLQGAAPRSSNKSVPTIDTMRLQNLPILGYDDIFIQSAVPVFSHNGSYIALFFPISGYSNHTGFWNETRHVKHFCRSHDGLHEAIIEKFGDEETDPGYHWEVVWKCAWPVELNSSGCHNVTVEEASSKSASRRVVGSVQACDKRKANEDRAYKIAACVKPLWEVPGMIQDSGLVKLPQWMEYNAMHGVEHFMIYTILSKEVERNITLKIAEPYFRAGLASHIDIDMPHGGDKSNHKEKRLVQLALENDCLYRFKGRSQWVMPSVDVDEYIEVPGQTATTSFAEILPPPTGVHAFYFYGYRHVPVSNPMQMLDIESTRRCAVNQYSEHPMVSRKYLANSDSSNTLHTHMVVSHLSGTTDVNGGQKKDVHYRHYQTSTHDCEYSTEYNDSEIVDDSLTGEVGTLLQKLQMRFGMPWEHLESWAHNV